MANAGEALNYGVRRGINSFLGYRKLQLQQAAQSQQSAMEHRRLQIAEDKATQDAAEKTADQKAGEQIGEMNKAVSNLLASPSSYDETGRLRADVWDGQVEPILGQMSGIQSKSYNGISFVNSIRMRVAHRLPQPLETPKPGSLSDEEGFLQDYMAAEEDKNGGPLSAAQRIEAHAAAVERYAQLKATGTATGKGEKETTPEERIRKMAEGIIARGAGTPEMALKQAAEFEAAFQKYQENPDIFLNPPPTSAPEATPKSDNLLKIRTAIQLIMGASKLKKFRPAATNPAAEPDTVYQDIDSLAKEKPPTDLGDNPGGIDINAKAEDETAPAKPSFNYFEDLQDYLKKKLESDKDTTYYNRLLSAGGRALPKRKK